MAEKIIERTEHEREVPRETTVVHEHDHRSSNTGVIVAVIILFIILLLLLFGRGLFRSSGGSSTPAPSVNVKNRAIAT